MSAFRPRRSRGRVLPQAKRATKGWWNGERADFRVGTAVVAESPAPLFWGRYIVGRRVRAVEVAYGGQRFYLYDGDGSGLVKVTTGHGLPSWPHRGMQIRPGSFSIWVPPGEDDQNETDALIEQARGENMQDPHIQRLHAAIAAAGGQP